MDKIVIIGSGASGVHFALSVLEKGYAVTMVDVGYVGPAMVNPGDTFADLKFNLSDPVKYFLGQNYEAVVHPGSKGEYYGFPPSKNYVFTKPAAFDWEANGFAPLSSFARGGLAGTWTGGVYPLNEAELEPFPFSYEDIEPFFSKVAKRIGIAGVNDDLARFYPVHDNLMGPLRLDQHSKLLLEQYENRKVRLNTSFNCYVGRSRVATLSADKGSRSSCSYCGRCLWGCPTGSLYTPSLTLDECRRHPNFTYLPNMYASHFKFDGQNRIQSVRVAPVAGGTPSEVTADRFVLAAGTLSSSRIFMESIWKETGQLPKLTGLMDNRQILIPFINLKMIGAEYDAESYQYHQIALGIESGRPDQYIHGQITTLKSALVHPILQNIPLDLQTAIKVFRNVRAGLGVVNVNLGDHRRANNFVTLQSNISSGHSKLLINYAPAAGERANIKRVVKHVKKCLWQLGCFVPPGMMHIRPMGASVHYAGTVPMSERRLPLTSSKYCQSHDFENLYFVDGTTFPALPAKNITFALMSNAVRVAEQAF
jgi:choline dehydrogenase-like flavoprotein